MIKFSFTLEMMLFTINNVYFSCILKKFLSNGCVFILLSVYEAIIYIIKLKFLKKIFFFGGGELFLPTVIIEGHINHNNNSN